ncbi:hypothetical protein NBRC110019_24260 [Neptunitalea chrysea]|uniref:Uncharacterized protein n=1 Tax=Neptunitalea chrysea TaxID=1647581 RepID=A0A9W6B832_9FLAO|nr:hypothetical protein [Neptunitalea chrysea]GLB53385.1 hypothetical protein NBRC110019_24260 [Neptunitalea chrysea]
MEYFEDNPLMQIGNEVANDSAFGTNSVFYKKPCDEFTDSFYTRSAKLQELADDLKRNRNSSKFNFDYTNYEGEEKIIYAKAGSGDVYPFAKNIYTQPEPQIIGTSFTYINDDNEETNASFYSSLNTTVYGLDKNYSYQVNIYPQRQEAVFRFYMYYKNTKDCRANASDEDRRKYTAIILSTHNPEDLIAFIEHIDSRTHIRKAVEDKFLDKFKSTEDSKSLKWLYELAPQFVIDKLDREKLWEGFQKLLTYDETGWFVDSSNVLIKILKGIYNQEKSVKFLYDKLEENPQTIIKTYNLLEKGELKTSIEIVSQKTDDGEEISLQSSQKFVTNKSIFASLMNAICLSHMNESNDGSNEHIKRDIVFSFDDTHRVDSNIVTKDTSADKIDLTQQEKQAAHYLSYSAVPRVGSNFKRVSWKNIGQTKSLHPMDMVTLKMVDEKNETITILAPAIFVKDLAYQKEWEEVKELIEIGANILALAFGIATLFSGTPFLIFLGILDIGVAASGLAIIAFKEEILQLKYGKELLAVLEKVYFYGGLATAIISAPALVRSTLTLATSIYKLASTAAKKPLRILITKLISNFNGNTVKNAVIGVEEVFKGTILRFKTAQLTRLEKAGVVFMGLTDETNEIVARIAVFRDEIIISASSIEELQKILHPKLVNKGEKLSNEIKTLYFEKRFERLKEAKDVATNNVFGTHEIESFIDLELKYDGISRVSVEGEAGDIQMLSGLLEGKSLDPMGLPDREEAINAWAHNYTKNWNKFKASLHKHFKKIHAPESDSPPLDYVVIDFKNMDKFHPDLQQRVLDYIESPTFEYKQYVDDKYLIKLNLK